MTYSIDDIRDAEWDYEFEPDPELESVPLVAGELEEIRDWADEVAKAASGWAERADRSRASTELRQALDALASRAAAVRALARAQEEAS